MDTIQLRQALPCAFAGLDSITSDFWHKEVALRKGTCCLIEAASGTGKSSLLSFLYGHRQDYEGIICFDGQNIRSYSVSQWTEIRRRSLSLLFQELRLFPELTAWENVQIKNRLTGHKRKQDVCSLFEALHLESKMHTPAARLSFGQQQRVAFIRSLCQPFDFILLDEPVSHLDDDNARTMAGLLQEEAARQNAGVIVTSIGRRLPLTYDQTIKL